MCLPLPPPPLPLPPRAPQPPTPAAAALYRKEETTLARTAEPKPKGKRKAAARETAPEAPTPSPAGESVFVVAPRRSRSVAQKWTPMTGAAKHLLLFFLLKSPLLFKLESTRNCKKPSKTPKHEKKMQEITAKMFSPSLGATDSSTHRSHNRLIKPLSTETLESWILYKWWVGG